MDNFSPDVLPSLAEINKDWLWLIFFVVFFLFGILTMVLIYHWHKYSIRNKGVFVAEAVYLLGSALFLLGAASSIIAF